jgi:hypothetical protein
VKFPVLKYIIGKENWYIFSSLDRPGFDSWIYRQYASE